MCVCVCVCVCVCAFGETPPFPLLESTTRTHTCTWTEFLGRKGKNSLIPNSRTITHLEQLLRY